MFPAEVTELNDWVSFARREGTVYSFKGPRPVFSHAEPDQASFRMFTSPWVIKGNCTQAEIVRALGISVISLKRSVKPYRPQGAAGFFKSRAARQPRVLTSAVRQKAQELIQQGRGRHEVAQELGLKSDTLRKALQAGRILEPLKKK